VEGCIALPRNDWDRGGGRRSFVVMGVRFSPDPNGEGPRCVSASCWVLADGLLVDAHGHLVVLGLLWG
jgi:hypothetical protein